MNHKQRDRRYRRRVAAKPSLRGPRVLSQESFGKVRKGHIVPAVYQRNFAIVQQVAVHFNRSSDCEIRNVKSAGTRGAFYRRTRPDGSCIDDIEASLSALESAAQPVFADLRSGGPLTLERKGVLAQFFGMQMVRGPAFFSERADLMRDLVSQLSASDFKPSARAEASGDVVVLRERLLQTQLASTETTAKMLSVSMRVAAVIGSMRWHLLDFGAPLLAYSDHPVVVWPAELTAAEPFAKPRLGPLGAIEVRVPLSPQLAVLMTWSDVPDTGTPVAAEARFAGELNACVVAQAEEEWMHQPGTEPPVAEGRLMPLSQAFELSYAPAQLAISRRRAFAADFLHRVRKQVFLGEIQVANMQWPGGS